MSNRKTKKKSRPGKSALQKQLSICPNCGESGPHFVGPSFGSSGFFTCKTKEEDGT